jgi:hypothetical protein
VAVLLGPLRGCGTVSVHQWCRCGGRRHHFQVLDGIIQLQASHRAGELKGTLVVSHSITIFVVKNPVSLNMKSSRGKIRLQFRL